MCEPMHSIVQYPDKSDDDMNLPFGNIPMDKRIESSLGSKVASWGRKISNWFHFSKIGSGHTDAIELSGKSSLILPEHTRYEGIWWDRKFKLDGSFYGPIVDKELALESAEKYHKDVVMSSISTFRRFFEASINKSIRPNSYVIHFLEDVLNKKGRDVVCKKLKRLFGGFNTKKLFDLHSKNKTQATKVVMGFTRQRELYLPHWADDNTLWK